MQSLVKRTLFYDPLIEFRAGLDAWGRPGYRPAEDVVTGEDQTIIRLDVPGVPRESLSIETQEGVLTVKGERRAEAVTDQAGIHRLERAAGSFSRSWRLADGVDSDKIEANLEDGVLEISVPKPERAEPHKIEVKESVPALEASEEE